MKKRIALLLAVLFLAGACACEAPQSTVPGTTGSETGLPASVPSASSDSGQTGTPAPLPSILDETEDPALAKTILTIGEYEVSYGLFRYYYNALRSRLLSSDPEAFSAEKAAASEETLKTQATEYSRLVACYFLLAKRLEIRVPETADAEFEESVRRSEEALALSGMTFQQYFGTYMPLSVYKIFYLLDNHVSSGVENAVADEKNGLLDLSEEAIAKAAENYRTVKHILVKFSETVSEEQALETAQTLLQKLREGEDFDALMKEYSGDYHESGSNVYTFTYGQMVKPFEDSAFTLEENELSEPVKSVYGYHVLLRLPLDESFRSEIYPDLAANDFFSKECEALTIVPGAGYEDLTDETLTAAL